jgi:mono/diheme cytochrome c family protein
VKFNLLRKVRFNRLTAAASLVAVSMATPLLAQSSGATIYKAKCQMCHLADGTGNKGMKVPAFTAGASDASLIAATKNGKGKMPAYAGKLTDADIDAVVAYIKTLKK